MVKRSIAIAVCFAAWAVVALSVSSASVEARKLMEFGNVGWEDEMSRLDYLDSKLREEPESICLTANHQSDSEVLQRRQ